MDIAKTKDCDICLSTLPAQSILLWDCEQCNWCFECITSGITSSPQKIRLATKLVRTRYSHSDILEEHTPKSQQTHTSQRIHEMVRKTRTMESNQMSPLLSLDPFRPYHRSKDIGLSNMSQKHLSRVFEISSRRSMQKNEKGRSQSSVECTQTRRCCNVS
jgi:hypothetical protein